MMISTHGYVAAEPELGKPDTGGQVVYVLELSRCLGRMGYAVDIFTRRFEGQPRVEKLDERVRVVRIPAGGKHFIPKEQMVEVVPEWVTNALEYIEAKGLSYQFVNSHYWDAGWAGIGVSHALNIPHLHTPHSIGTWKRDNMEGDAVEMEKRYNFRERVRCENILFSEAQAVLATTGEQRRLLRDEEYDVPDEKIMVLPPGYDDTRFFPVGSATKRALKQEQGLEGRVVLALGRIARNKGYDLLIRSMVPVFQRLEDVKLVLEIGNETRDELEETILAELHQVAAETGYADRVLFRHRFITDEELPDLYRSADVFALSSRYEPFGMTAVEAMACGTPTVVTTEGGLWEQVRWGVQALYADPNDPEAFGHAILQVLQHPAVHKTLHHRGSERARERFTWTGISQRLLNKISQLGRGQGH